MIYFDNGATTFPKPRRVLRAVQNAFDRYGANPGRSGHKMSMDTAVQVYECREAAAEMFGSQPDEVVFTSNCSHALNMVIKGILRKGDHVVISDLEHNSVLRPVHMLAQLGMITYTVARVHSEREETVASFAAAITPQTRLIACTHASNAFGLRVPIEEIGELAHSREILFLVDAAQTAGVLEIDMQRQNIDFLCMAGHKSLYGPSGTGMLLTPFGMYLQPLMEGGTGSDSANYNMPQMIPDRLECGTVNTVGILGLKAGMEFVKERGIPAIHRQEMAVAGEIYNRLSRIDRVRLYTPTFDGEHCVPVVSFNVEGLTSEEVTEKLSQKGFALRGGLHCAPLAHEKMGTMESGAVRASVGVMNTPQQARQLCQAVQVICAQ